MEIEVQCVCVCVCVCVCACVCVCINVGLLFLGEWITPTVTGDRPPPIHSFT